MQSAHPLKAVPIDAHAVSHEQKLQRQESNFSESSMGRQTTMASEGVDDSLGGFGFGRQVSDTPSDASEWVTLESMEESDFNAASTPLSPYSTKSVSSISNGALSSLLSKHTAGIPRSFRVSAVPQFESTSQMPAHPLERHLALVAPTAPCPNKDTSFRYRRCRPRTAPAGKETTRVPTDSKTADLLQHRAPQLVGGCSNDHQEKQCSRARPQLTAAGSAVGAVRMARLGPGELDSLMLAAFFRPPHLYSDSDSDSDSASDRDSDGDSDSDNGSVSHGDSSGHDRTL